MKREQLLSELENEYANIYEFTGDFGDEPLNILDQFIDEAGISTEADLHDHTTLNFLSDNTLAQLLQVYKQVVQECKVELQD